MRKKGIGLLAFLSIMALLFVPMASAAELESGTQGDFIWEEITVNGQVEVAITGYTGTATSVTFPAVVDGDKQVTIIGSMEETQVSAFGTGLVSVVIPEGIERLGGRAFRSCASLSGVQLPSTLKHIAFAAFQNCAALTQINLPNGLLSIGEGAFRGSGLTSVTLPASLTSVQPEAFAGCTALDTVTVQGANTQFSEETDFPTQNYAGKIFAAAPLSTGIIGQSGSIAQAYAAAHNIKFGLISSNAELSDTSAGVAVSGSLPTGSSLEVVKVASNTDAFKNAQKSAGDDKVLLLFDINLKLGGQKVQPNGSVQVEITIPEAYKNEPNLAVAYIDDAGRITILNSSVKDGKITFEAAHFSSYAIVRLAAGNDANPGTGGIFMSEAFAALAMLAAASILGGMALGLKRRRKHKAAQK